MKLKNLFNKIKDPDFTEKAGISNFFRWKIGLIFACLVWMGSVSAQTTYTGDFTSGSIPIGWDASGLGFDQWSCGSGTYLIQQPQHYVSSPSISFQNGDVVEITVTAASCANGGLNNADVYIGSTSIGRLTSGTLTYSLTSAITGSVKIVPYQNSALGVNVVTIVLTSACTPIAISRTPQTICVGGTITLPTSSNAPGGTWTLTGFTNNGDGTATHTGSAGDGQKLIYTKPGSATDICDTAQITVNVKADPVVSFTAGDICVDGTKQLSISNNGISDAVTWTSNAPGTASVNSSGVVTGVAAGSTTFYARQGNAALGCTSANSASLTVIPKPTITEGTSTTVMVGGNKTLNATPAGGTWSGGNENVALVSSTTGEISGVNAGTATFTYTTTSGCTSTITVTAAADECASLGYMVETVEGIASVECAYSSVCGRIIWEITSNANSNKTIKIKKGSGYIATNSGSGVTETNWTLNGMQDWGDAKLNITGFPNNSVRYVEVVPNPSTGGTIRVTTTDPCATSINAITGFTGYSICPGELDVRAITIGGTNIPDAGSNNDVKVSLSSNDAFVFCNSDGSNEQNTVYLPGTAVNAGTTVYVRIKSSAAYGTNSGNVTITAQVGAGGASGAYNGASNTGTIFGTVKDQSAAPSGLAGQKFCGSTTVAGLAAPGVTGVKWYNESGVYQNPATALEAGQTYSFKYTQTESGKCESELSASPITVNVYDQPTLTTANSSDVLSQTVCFGTSLANTKGDITYTFGGGATGVVVTFNEAVVTLGTPMSGLTATQSGNNITISGTANITYSITTTKENESPCSNVTSKTGTITVMEAPSGVTVFSSYGDGQICANSISGQLSLQGTLVNGDGAQYNWQRRTSTSPDEWSETLSTGDTLLFSNAGLQTGNNVYRCTITNSCGLSFVATSTTQVLTSSGPSAPGLDASGAATTELCPDSISGTLALTGADSDVTGYQWQRSLNGGGYTDLDNQTAATLDLSAAGVAGIGANKYRCVVRNACGYTTSSSESAVYTITNAPTNGMAVTPQNVSADNSCLSAFTGNTATLSVDPDGVADSYQWQKWNGSEYVNATGDGAATSSLILNGTNISEGLNRFRCLLGQTGCNITDVASASFDVTVAYNTVITTQPSIMPRTVYQDVTLFPNTLSVAATGKNLVYTWYRSTSSADLEQGKTVVGTGQEHTPDASGLTLNTSFYYYCVVTGDCGAAATSAPSGSHRRTDCRTDDNSITWRIRAIEGSISGGDRELSVSSCGDGWKIQFRLNSGTTATIQVTADGTNPSSTNGFYSGNWADYFNGSFPTNSNNSSSYRNIRFQSTEGGTSLTTGTNYWLYIRPNGCLFDFTVVTDGDCTIDETCPVNAYLTPTGGGSSTQNNTTPFPTLTVEVPETADGLYYTWHKITNGGSTSDEIVSAGAGAAYKTLVPDNSEINTTGFYYYCVVTKPSVPACTSTPITSNSSGEYFVEKADCTNPSIGTQPATTAATAEQGSAFDPAVNLTVSGISGGGGGNYTYTWYRTTNADAPAATDDFPRTGDVRVSITENQSVTNNTYTPNAVTEKMDETAVTAGLAIGTYRYFCVVSVDNCKAVSNRSGVFTVKAPCQIPVISPNGSSVEMCSNATIQFSHGLGSEVVGTWTSSNKSAADFTGAEGLLIGKPAGGQTNVTFTLTGCPASAATVVDVNATPTATLSSSSTNTEEVACKNTGLFEHDLSVIIGGSGIFTSQWYYDYEDPENSVNNETRIPVGDEGDTRLSPSTDGKAYGNYYYYVEVWNTENTTCRVTSNRSAVHTVKEGKCNGIPAGEIFLDRAVISGLGYTLSEVLRNNPLSAILLHGEGVTGNTEIFIDGTDAAKFQVIVNTTGIRPDADAWGGASTLTTVTATEDSIYVWVRIRTDIQESEVPVNKFYSATLNVTNGSATNSPVTASLSGTVRRSVETDCHDSDIDMKFYDGSTANRKFGEGQATPAIPSSISGGDTVYIKSNTPVTIGVDQFQGKLILDGVGPYTLSFAAFQFQFLELRINAGTVVYVYAPVVSDLGSSGWLTSNRGSIYNRGIVNVKGEEKGAQTLSGVYHKSFNTGNFRFNGAKFFNNGVMNVDGMFTPAYEQSSIFVNNGLVKVEKDIMFVQGNVCLATGTCFFAEGDFFAEDNFYEPPARVGITGGGGVHFNGNSRPNTLSSSGRFLNGDKQIISVGGNAVISYGIGSVQATKYDGTPSSYSSSQISDWGGNFDPVTNPVLGSEFGCYACYALNDRDENFFFQDSVCADAGAEVKVVENATWYDWDVEDGTKVFLPVNDPQPAANQQNWIKAQWNNDVEGQKRVSVSFLYDGNTCSRDFLVNVKHAVPLLWTGEGDDGTLWSNSANWAVVTNTFRNGRYVQAIGPNDNNFTPSECSDVYLQHTHFKEEDGAVHYYPTITGTGECRDIYFGMHTSVGNINRLSYRKARIDLTIPSWKNVKNEPNWFMISPPLKNMFSGSYTYSTADALLDGNQPYRINAYIRYFSVTGGTNTQDGGFGDYTGVWSKSVASTTVRLEPAGMGYALQYSTNNPERDHTFFFPKTSVTGDSLAYRFITEDTTIGETPSSFPVYVDLRDRFGTDPDNLNLIQIGAHDNMNMPNGGFVIVGNPFMSHLDLNEFVKVNAGTISNNVYRFISESSSFEVADSDKDGYLDSIPPMQSFFVQLRPRANVEDTVFLTFTEAMAVGKSGENHHLLKGSQTNTGDRLRLQVKFVDRTSLVSVVKAKSGASNLFYMNEDAQKLFSNDAPLEVYTFAGTVPCNINVLNADSLADVIVPIGIRTKFTGRLTLTVSGISGFTSADNIWLVDSQEGTRTSLFERETFDIILAAGTSEDRFFLYFDQEQQGSQGNTTDVTEIEPQAGIIYVNTAGNMLNVLAHGEQIEEVTVYDLFSRTVLSAKGLNTGYYAHRLPDAHAVYLVKVTTGKRTETRKVIVK